MVDRRRIIGSHSPNSHQPREMNAFQDSVVVSMKISFLICTFFFLIGLVSNLIGYIHAFIFLSIMFSLFSIWDRNNRYKEIIYFDNGKMQHQISMKNGISDGHSISWYRNGNTKSITYFENGKPHGKCIIWHENGKKKMEKYYKNGIKHGKFKCWDENGVRLGEGDVVNGLPHGISITYDSNGLKIIEATFKYGVLHGHKTHFKNGFVEFVEIFENGNRIDVLNNYMSSIIEYKSIYIN